MSRTSGRAVASGTVLRRSDSFAWRPLRLLLRWAAFKVVHEGGDGVRGVRLDQHADHVVEQWRDLLLTDVFNDIT